MAESLAPLAHGKGEMPRPYWNDVPEESEDAIKAEGEYPMSERALQRANEERSALAVPRSCPWCDLAMAATAILCAANPAHVPLWLLGAFPAIAVVRLLMTGRMWMRTPIDWPLAIICLMGVASRGITALPAVTHDAFVYLVAGVAMLAAVAGWSTSSGRLALALVALGLTGVALIALSPLTTRLLAAWPQAPSQPGALLAPGASSIHPNILAGAMALLVPVALALAVGRPGLKRGILVRSALGLVFAALCVAVALTQSRGAYIGIGVGCMLVLTLTDRRFLWLIPVGLVAIAVGIWQAGWPNLVGWISSSGDITNLEGRLEIWNRALYMLQDVPFTGIGMGTSNQTANIFYPFFLAGPNAAVPHAHNLFLQVGVDLGIPGLVAFLAMWGLVAWMAWAVYAGTSFQKHTCSAAGGVRWIRQLSIGLLGSYAAIFAHGLLDAPTWGTRPAILMWALFGLMIGAWRVYCLERCSSAYLPTLKRFDSSLKIDPMEGLSSD